MVRSVLACCAGLVAIGAALAGGGLRPGTDVPMRAASATVTLRGTYKLHVASSRHGSFSVTVFDRRSCKGVGKYGTGSAYVGGPNAFAVPGPPPANSTAKNVSFVAQVVYKRPGAFGKKAFRNGGGADIIVGKNSYNPLAKAATIAMTVKSKGSGVFTFSHAPPVKRGKALSGEVTWHCSD